MCEAESVLLLAQRFAAKRRIQLTTLGRLTVGNASIFVRLREGRITLRTLDRILQHFSDHWPADLDWPADIPRPPKRREAA